MADEWRESTWGDEISLQYGKALRGYNARVGKFRVFGSNGPIGWTDKPLADGPGVILGRKGAYRGVQFSREPFFVIDTAYFVSPKTNLDMRWLFYAIKYHNLGEINDGSPIPSTTRAAVYIRNLNVPPLSEQRAIAHILGTLDDKIEVNRRMNETLEAMARALFKSWFIDFDPVRAKADGRKPEGMDEATAKLFPDSFEQSELGAIPKGWKPCHVLDIADINGWTLSSRDKLEFIRYVEISEVMRGDVSSITEYARGSEPSRARRRLRHGDTALSTVRPDRGAYFLCLRPEESLIASTGFAVLTPRQVPWAFLHAAIARDDVLRELGHLADGGAYPAVRPEVVGNLETVTPKDTRILDAFHSVCEPFYLKADNNRRESRSLAATRDALLPKLLSGELRVKDAERFAEAVP